MKIRLLANISGMGVYQQVVDRPDAEAKMVVDAGLGEYVDEPRAPKPKAHRPAGHVDSLDVS